MFMFIPHSAEVSWGRVPWLVLGLMAICTVIYYAEYRNNQAIEHAFGRYCTSAPEQTAGAPSGLRREADSCLWALTVIHTRPEKRLFYDLLLRRALDPLDPERSKAATEEVESAFREYDEARLVAPSSLDAKLMADPLFFNPLRSISSALAHGSWWHLIGNMIFFFAFAPALEMVIGSRLRLAMAMVVIALVCDLAYFGAVHLFDFKPLPALGFSGVVTGMIGLSAYLLPRVRIRTFVWVFLYARNIYVPAAVLAAWYIGWDAWYMISGNGTSGVNFVAHVFGGITGYLLGRYWFSSLKEEIGDEVADEIEHHQAKRRDALGVLSSYRPSRPRSINVERELLARRDFSTFLDQIYHAVNVGNDAMAINLMLSRYDEYRHAIELYEEIYDEMLKWPQSRAILCLSRLLITEYISLRKYARANEVAQRAQQSAPEFVFAEPGQRELLAAMTQGTPMR